MDYKKILKSRKLRMAILDVLSFVPDKPMIQLQYRIKTGRKLNLKNPKRYTEKLQWYKLYYRDPLMAQCADKYEVRKYVESLGLGHILNECYGVFDKPEDIDFAKLPNQFVLKDTLGGGGNSVIICKDKSKADIDSYIKQMNEWVHTKPIRSGGREWPYYSGKFNHRIIVEKIISTTNKGGLTDYKFFCFDGKPYCLYVMNERYTESGVRQNILNLDFKIMPFMREQISGLRYISKPQKFDEMIAVAERLSKNFPYVRIDLYYENNQIIFGEFTYFPESGYYNFDPDEFDFILGEKFDLPRGGQDNH